MFLFKRERKGLKGFFPKLSLVWKNKNYKNNKTLSFFDVTSKMGQSFKLFIRLFLFSLLPILFFFLIIFAIIVAVWQWFNPIPDSINSLNMIISSPSKDIMVGGFVQYVLQAIAAVLYMIFIQPILLLLGAFQTIIIFLANGQIINKLLFGDKKIIQLPPIFWVTLGIALGLLFIFISIKIIDIIAATGDKKIQKIKTSSHNLFISMIGIVLIPTIFYLVNTLLTSVLNLIITNIVGPNKDLGLVIFNSSFNDGIHNFKQIPASWEHFDGIENFDFILCLVASVCICYMSFMVVILIVETSLIITFLFMVGIIVIFSSVADEGRRFFAWKEITIARFVTLLAIYLIYSFFVTSVTVTTEISTLLPKDLGLVRSVLNLVFMFTAFGAVLQSPKLVDAIMGGTTMMDGMARILGVHNTTKQFLTNTLVGREKGRQRRELRQGKEATTFNTAGGLVGATRGVGNYFKRSIKDLQKGV